MNEAFSDSRAHEITEMGQILGSLLSVAGIHQLVIVDDSYIRNDDDVETILVKAQVSPEKFAGLFPALGALEDDEGERISTIVRQTLEQDPSQIARALQLCWSDADNDAGLDAQTMSVLDQLVRAIPEDAAVQALRLSGDDWQEQAVSIFTPERGNALVLVDRDFTHEGKSMDFGLTVIASLLQGRPSGIYCALISHTVVPGDELEYWHALAAENQIPQHQFVVISKRRLAEERPDLAGFLHLMRLAVLCRPLQKLRDTVRDHFAKAIETTVRDLNAWSVFDFDEAVFGSSRDEGIWEGETLLRVMSTFSMLAARNDVRCDTTVRELISFSRRASAVQIPHDELHPWKNVGQMALAYQRTELYLDRTYVNEQHLPLAAGDVFDRGDGKVEHILLAQPCDLMVRGESGRAYDSGLMVPLCQVDCRPASADGQSYELPWWEKDGHSGFVHFSKVHLVRISMLDLCVLHADGSAVFDASTDLPESLSDSWRQYASERLLKQLRKEYGQSVRLISQFLDAKSKISKEIRQLAEARFLPCCSNTGRFKSKVNHCGFTVNLRRTRRVNPTFATDILRAFARHQSRTAFEQSVVTQGLRRRMAMRGTNAAEGACESPID